TLDGGTGTDTLRYDNANGFGTNTTNALTFTLAANSSGGTVTDGTRTDTFTSFETFFGGTNGDSFVGGSGAETFNGNDGDDTFQGRGGNDTFNGGNNNDTASYANAAAGVTANLASGATTDGDGGADTYNSIENLIGSNFADNLTDATGNNTINGGSGNDTIIGNSGNDTYNGGGDIDTLTYSTSTALAINLNLSQITGLGTDSYLNIENIFTGTGSDTITTTAANLFANTIQFDLGGGAGSDRITIGSVGTVGTDATTFASKFDNVERLDFLLANTSGGNMVIDGTDVFDITGTSRNLRLDISSAFGLTVNAGAGYTLNIDNSNIAFTRYNFQVAAVTQAQLDVYVT
ncbi:MAG: hypothetical protein K2Q01_11420, partial [Rickettsiales bacterium]|nr:hypothetical protein [Rickettsiales bacterium]